MGYQHKKLAEGRWNKLSFAERMANIGSEIERAIKWRAKDNLDYFQKAFERALELVDLTLESPLSFTKLKEVARLREVMVDYFLGTNQFMSTDALWRHYFMYFNCAARKNQ